MKKSRGISLRTIIDGKVYCPMCKEYKPIEQFSKNKNTLIKLNCYCKSCVKKRRSIICNTIKIKLNKKKCNRCKKYKSIDRFGKNIITKDGTMNRCKNCNNKQKNIYKNNNPKHFSAISRKTRLKHKYGITIEEYNNMYIKQNGNCATCCRHFDKLHIDHDHNTNKVRGLLCNECNAAYGFLYENTNTIIKMLEYKLNSTNNILTEKSIEIIKSITDKYKNNNILNYLPENIV